VKTADRTASPPPCGAYGIALSGLEEAADLLVRVDGDAPAYRVDSAVHAAEPGPEHVGDDRAELRVHGDGRALIDRRASTVRFLVPRPVRSDELVHPFLAPAAAVIARWLGRESVHAGAIALEGRALGVVGARHAGKSSTLAWMALNGGEVLCDDMLVVDRRRAFPGPRTIDLRQDAAAELAAGEAIGVTGARERWRLRLAPVRVTYELTGFVHLAWGDGVAVRRLGLAERLQRLVPQRALRIEPAREDAVLQLAAMPAWELSRPRSWASLPETAQRLLELASTTPTAGA
jgi:hypothetical protein